MADALNFRVTVTPSLESLASAFASMASGGATDFLRTQILSYADRAVQITKDYAPTDTGAFARGISWSPYGLMGFQVISDNAQLLNMLRTGTGVYAGNGRIFPMSARALVFNQWKTPMVAPNYGQAWAFRSIAGMKANLWEQPALNAILSEMNLGFGAQASLSLLGALGL